MSRRARNLRPFRGAERKSRVRRNASGQLLAYGVFWCGRVVARAGFALSAAGASVPGAAPAAIRRTVEHMARYRLAEEYLPDWVQLADECIARLPVEELA